MTTALEPAPRISLTGLSGCGKSTVAAALAAELAARGIESVALKLASALYEVQRAYYTAAGAGEHAGPGQDQQLLHRIATDLRRVKKTALLDKFRHGLREIDAGTAVINDDLRDAGTDAPGLRECGFVLIRLTCDEQVRAERLAARGDLSRINERAIFGPELEAMRADHVIDTTSADPHDCARQILDVVASLTPAAREAARAARAASTRLAGGRDTTHVWGEYIETVLNPVTLMREIQVYPGGRTSIHRHKLASEINFIAGGAVRLFSGYDPENLTEEVRGSMDVIHISPGMYHAVAFERGESATQPCARFFEFVYNYNSPCDIERFSPALPGARPADSGAGFSGWIAAVG